MPKAGSVPAAAVTVADPTLTTAPVPSATHQDRRLHSEGGLPDSACTPSAVDPRVDQADVGSTIVGQRIAPAAEGIHHHGRCGPHIRPLRGRGQLTQVVRMTPGRLSERLTSVRAKRDDQVCDITGGLNPSHDVQPLRTDSARLRRLGASSLIA